MELEVEDINPYENSGEKGEQVERMFDSIAPAYDFMNTAMTMGLHKVWRNIAIKNALKFFSTRLPENILDVATGTGDLVFKLHKRLPDASITGIDLSAGMLKFARQKLEKLSAIEKNKISFGKADCLALPFFNDNFDLVTVAYGVRNFSNLPAGLKEMRRVLSPAGVLCLIELSVPQGKFTNKAYRLYSGSLIPFVGKRISGDSRAYSYLPESVAACPQREKMAALLKKAGFNNVMWQSLTFGAVTYYIAR